MRVQFQKDRFGVRVHKQKTIDSPALQVPCARNPDGVTILRKKKLNAACNPRNGCSGARGLESRRIDRLLLVDSDTKRSFWNWTLMSQLSRLRRGGFLSDWSPALRQRCATETQAQPGNSRLHGTRAFSDQPTRNAQPETPPKSTSSAPTSSNILPPRMRVAGQRDGGSDHHSDNTPISSAGACWSHSGRRNPSCDYRQGRQHFGASGLSRRRFAGAVGTRWPSANGAINHAIDGEPAEVDTTITITFSLLD